MRYIPILLVMFYSVSHAQIKVMTLSDGRKIGVHDDINGEGFISKNGKSLKEKHSVTFSYKETPNSSELLKDQVFIIRVNWMSRVKVNVKSGYPILLKSRKEVIIKSNALFDHRSRYLRNGIYYNSFSFGLPKESIIEVSKYGIQKVRITILGDKYDFFYDDKTIEAVNNLLNHDYSIDLDSDF